MINNIDILHIGLIVGGLTLLIWGSDRFVYGASALAKNFGVTPLLIGLTIVAFATSAPEILVSIISAIQEEPGLAYGNALGSNIINIGLILGLTAVIRPIALEPTLNKKMQILLIISLLIALLFLDASISRLDGVIMLLSLSITMFWFVKIETQFALENSVKNDSESGIKKNISMKLTIFWLLSGLFALLIGADLLVDGAIGIARTLNISEIIIGITIVALGTSLPELSISIVSALKDEYGLAIGNIVGSNIFTLNKKSFELINSVNQIKSYNIKKIYPNQVKVYLESAKAIGFVKNINEFVVLGNNGKIIEPETLPKNIPEVTGTNDMKKIFQTIEIIKKSDFNIKKIKKINFFPSKRIDIEFENKKKIKFPINFKIDDLNFGFRVINDKKFNQVKVIDLRIPNKVITDD